MNNFQRIKFTLKDYFYLYFSKILCKSFFKIKKISQTNKPVAKPRSYHINRIYEEGK